MTRAIVETGVASRALAGQPASGDRHLVQAFENGLLLAVVDGVGHGREAATAAELAVRTLAAHARDPVIDLMVRCHERLRGTRGAAMSLASLNGCDGTLTWSGTGNVEGVVWRADPRALPRHVHLMVRGGILGSHMPQPLSNVLNLSAGDVVTMVTDGVRGDFIQLIGAGDPQRIAERILSRYASETDDALVFVARYTGGGR